MAIKKIWLLIGSFILGAPKGASADPAQAAPAQKIDASTPDEDKAAAAAASSDADQWAATHKAEAPKPPTPTEAASPSPAAQTQPATQAQAPTPAAAPNPATMPGVTAPAAPPPSASVVKPPRPNTAGLNEMKGKLLSISDDPKTFRLLVDGGFNVEFTYDAKSSVVNGGDPIKVDELGYNDELIVRYAGKDLYAVEIERVSKAPRPE